MEVSQDSKMGRTKNRPLPTGRITIPQALMAAVTSGTVGTALLFSFTNGLTAALGTLTIALYAGAYTPLKMRHWSNTWVGAVVGAIPPVMGYVATQPTFSEAWSMLATAEPWVLFGILLFWQMPHFYSLAWMCRKDYGNAGYQMLSVSKPSSVGMAALRNTLALPAVCVGAVAAGMCDPLFLVTSSVINGFFAYRAYELNQAFRSGDEGEKDKRARKLFRASLLHLPVLLGLVWLHKGIAEKRKQRPATVLCEVCG
jgi:protoheme IX farnesyltransferase